MSKRAFLKKRGQKVPKPYFLLLFRLFWAYFRVCSVCLSCRGSRCSQTHPLKYPSRGAGVYIIGNEKSVRKFSDWSFVREVSIGHGSSAPLWLHRNTLKQVFGERSYPEGSRVAELGSLLETSTCRSFVVSWGLATRNHLHLSEIIPGIKKSAMKSSYFQNRFLSATILSPLGCTRVCVCVCVAPAMKHELTDIFVWGASDSVSAMKMETNQKPGFLCIFSKNTPCPETPLDQNFVVKNLVMESFGLTSGSFHCWWFGALRPGSPGPLTELCQTPQKLPTCLQSWPEVCMTPQSICCAEQNAGPKQTDESVTSRSVTWRSLIPFEFWSGQTSVVQTSVLENLQCPPRSDSCADFATWSDK